MKTSAFLGLSISLALLHLPAAAQQRLPSWANPALCSEALNGTLAPRGGPYLADKYAVARSRFLPADEGAPDEVRYLGTFAMFDRRTGAPASLTAYCSIIKVGQTVEAEVSFHSDRPGVWNYFSINRETIGNGRFRTQYQYRQGEPPFEGWASF